MPEVDLLGLKALKAVVDVGSITGSARELGWSKSSLSRRLTSLENALGKTLLKRHSSGAELTEEGEAYFEYAKQILLLSEQGKRVLESHSKELTGKLVIRVGRDFSRGWLNKSLVNFLKEHPKLQVDVLATDYEVQIMQQEADIWVWVGEEPESKLRYKALGQWRQKVYLNKDRVDEFILESPQDLVSLPWLQSPMDTDQVHLWRGEEMISLIPQDSQLRLDSISSLAERVAWGDGVALLPSCCVTCPYHGYPDLANLFPEWHGKSIPVGLLSHYGPQKKAVGLLIEYLMENVPEKWRLSD